MAHVPAPPAIPERETMRAVDVAWLRMDRPDNLMQINGVLAFDGPPDLQRLRDLIAARLTRIRRFRQRVVLRGGRYRWEAAHDFDITRHVVATEVPAPGDRAAAQRLFGALMSQPLDRAHPLWKFHLLPFEGGSAVFCRLHHAMGDGVAMMLVLLSMCDLEPGGPGAADVQGHPGIDPPPAGAECDAGAAPATGTDRGIAADGAAQDAAGGGTRPADLADLFGSPADRIAVFKRLTDDVMPDLMRLLTLPVEGMRRTSRAALAAASAWGLGKLVAYPPDPRAFKGRLSVEKRVAWSRPLPVDEVKAVGQALGGTINDVLLSAVGGGLHRHLAGRAAPPDEKLVIRAAMPVNLRSLDRMNELGNRFGLAFLGIPVGQGDPLRRMQELKRRADILKRSAEPLVVYGLLTAAGLMPLAVQRLLVAIFGAKATAVMTNVPGPRRTLYLMGRPIEDLFFWVPQSGTLSMGISILSYRGRVRLGFATDAGLVPDPEALVSGFDEEWALMTDLARRRSSPERAAAAPAPAGT